MISSVSKDIGIGKSEFIAKLNSFRLNKSEQMAFYCKKFEIKFLSCIFRR